MSGNSARSSSHTAPIVCSRGVVRGWFGASCSWEQEGHPVLADLHLVVGGEHGALDPVPVDERAVEAAEVADREGRSPSRTISAWRRETVTSSRKTWQSGERPMSVRSPAVSKLSPASPLRRARRARDRGPRRVHALLARARPGRGSGSSPPARPDGGTRRSGRSSSRPPGSGSRTPGSRRGSSRRAAEDRPEIRRRRHGGPAPPPLPLGPQDVDPSVEHAPAEREVVLLALELDDRRAQLVVRERRRSDPGAQRRARRDVARALEERSLERRRRRHAPSVPVSTWVRRRPTRSPRSASICSCS